MSLLTTVTTGRRAKPHFVLIYGVDGVGKTTFGAQAPAPVFLGCEAGNDHLNVARFPQPVDLKTFWDQLYALYKEPHDFKTCVVDSLDWLEPLIWAEVCREGGVSSIENYGGGFGKGYVRAFEIWGGTIRKFINLSKKMNVILIAHAMIKTFTDPNEATPYDRYQIKLMAKSDGKNDVSAKIREAVDCVLFANYEVTVAKNKTGDKGRAVGDGSRVIFTERRPAFDAKNRFNLPFELPLDWGAYEKSVQTYYQESK